jgi:hypothetical protein
MLRSQISAATHFPQHYLGDIGSANLATATSMELPVLKAVESRQEVIEQLFRWFFEQVIEEAIKSGRLPEELTAEEWAEREKSAREEGQKEGVEAPSGATTDAMGLDQQNATPAGATVEAATNGNGQGDAEQILAHELGPEMDVAGGSEAEVPEEIPEHVSEEDKKRDLGYDFGLPSPLRRMMTDLVTAISTIARTFDPNGTNMQLARQLLPIALGEGLEMNDPGEVVEKIFPPGYRDPLLAAQLAQANSQLQAAQGAAANPFAPPPGAANGNGNGGGQPPGRADFNPYGAPWMATPPGQNPYEQQQARLQAEGGVLLGDPTWTSREDALLQEALAQRLTPEAKEKLEARQRAVAEDWDEGVTSALMNELGLE